MQRSIVLAIGLISFWLTLAIAAKPIEPIDNSVSPIRGLMQRFESDRGALSRVFTISVSPNREHRIRELIRQYLANLRNIDFNSLSRDGQIDYLLFRNELDFRLAQLSNERKRNDEVSGLLPFATTIIQLEEDRRQLKEQDGRTSAELVSAISTMTESKMEELAALPTEQTPDAIRANRAATIAYELRRALDAWFRFYDSYDPEFSWWVKQPVTDARAKLDEYGKLLRDKFVGHDGEDDPIVGDPIGRDALLDALRKELIPFTPEELIEIAELEFKWCENEMKRAADDLGFNGDWQKTLNHVSQLHMKPGDQPKLIKQLADEAVEFLEARDLVTIPELCKRTWRMEMMSAERQKVSPYFTGGEVISVSYPTDAMSHEHKLMSMRGNNVHFSRATVQHELIPGHHLQGFMQQRYNSHRLMFRTPFLIEGWALYWEMLLWDLDFPQSAEDRVGMLFWRSHRCARIVFSLKFHLGEMTAQEAIDYLVERVGHERRNATAEVRRSVNGSYEPLYQAAYMLGGLQIRDLRRELVDSKKMTDREFHDAILRENSIPIPFIRASLSREALSPDWRSDWRFYDFESKVAGNQNENLTDRQQARVYRTRIEPHWFAENTKFWYQNETGPQQSEFVMVDTESGNRRPAFDHGRIATELTKTGRADVSADSLPLRSIRFSNSGELSQIILDDSSVFEVDGYSLAQVKTPTGSTSNTFDHLKSTVGGLETFVTFENRLKTQVQLIWIDLDGNRVGYETISSGDSHRQHTFAGHAWVVTETDGGDVCAVTANHREGSVRIDDEVRGKTLTPQPNRRRQSARSEQTAGVSPDGKWQAFVRDNDLWIREMETNSESRLTNDGTAIDTYSRDRTRSRAVNMQYNLETDNSSVADTYWSPDSKKLVAMRTKTAEERLVYIIESAPDDQLQPKLHSYPYFKPGDELPQSKPHLFDIESKAEIPIDESLFENPWSIGNVRWQNDSMRFTFLYNQRGHQVVRILAVDSATGQVAAIVNEETQTFFDYAGKMFARYLDETNEIIWMSERSGWNHLYLVDAESGNVKNPITSGDWVVRDIDRVDEAKRQVWFYAGGVHAEQDPYYKHYCRVNFDGTDFTVLTTGDGTHEVQHSPDGRFLIDTFSRVDMAPVNELRSAEDGSLVGELEKGDPSEILATGRRLPEPFVARGRDGKTDIYGIIHRPTEFDPSKQYPVIENIYAGPHSAHVPKSFRARYGHQQEIADRGFIVVQIDGMGTSHRSKAFHDVCWKNLGDAGFPDRIAWIKAAAENFPEMDTERVGIYGGSAGGQNSLRALLAHGDFYDVAVSDCGCHDNRMDKVWWNELWMGWPVGPHYAEQSNVTMAHELTGNLLLTVGELDRNVDPASTMQVVDALVKADKDFEMLVVPGRGHGVGETPYAKRRRVEFFVRHLAP